MERLRHRTGPPWMIILAVAALAAGCDNDEEDGYVLGPSLAAVGGEEVGAVFTVTHTGDAGAGSLRQALEDANATPGLDGIVFEIPGAGPHVIQPLSSLPSLVDPVVLDGYSQPGASPNTSPQSAGSNAVVKVVLDGSAGSPFSNGLVVLGDGSTIRGLAIGGFTDGVIVVGAGNRVQGTFIGVDASGGTAVPNRGYGIRVLGADNLVGGPSPAARNIVSGNEASGILLQGAGAVRNRVEGNYVGVDASGSSAIPNGLPEPAPVNSAGIHVAAGASENVIGGSGSMPDGCDQACNAVAGNYRTGIWIDAAHENTVAGNLIGTAPNGGAPLGQGRWGVFIGGINAPATQNVVTANRIEWSGRDGVAVFAGSSENTIGGAGTTPGTCDDPCNVIAFNGQRFDTQGDGVRLFANAGVGNAILGNSISQQPQGLGIDLAARGVNFPDPGDFDEGPNRLQNFPVLTSASTRGGHLVVSGSVDTQNPASALIQFYANPVPDPGADPSGFGEGAIYLGQAPPDSDGKFIARLGPVPEGTFITATATDTDGNTSEFAANIPAMPHRGPNPEDNPSFFPFSTVIYACSEPVTVTGAFHSVSLVTTDRAGGFHFNGHINAIGVGVGQLTGATYNWNDAINQQASFRGVQQTFTSVQSFALMGRGQADDLLLRARFHVTVTPQGVVDITVDDFSVTCR